MVRVFRCFDLIEAHIIVARLREEGIAAHVFDADFVRQNWFRMLAYGGFRVVVPDQSVGAAREILQRYQSGGLAIEDDADRVRCPRCAALTGNDDPQPRRNVFLGFIVVSVASNIVLAQWKPAHFDIVMMFVAQASIYLSLPWLVMRYFKWRQRCADCGHRWREPPRYRYADLAALAAAASRET